MAPRFLKIAVVYLFLGASLGLGMGITQNFALTPVHAHVLLLGWASLALAGLVYHLYPAAARSKIATIHFWLHNAGLPVFMVGLAFVTTGHPAMIPVTAAGAIMALAGLAHFVVNVLRNVRAA